ncbi:MAG: pyridoxamine 5'-phosphate oxidase family protein [Pontiellaceae bacterium]|nr:pyridoxamine 5'-phosphate oxidase family protein [Pontiellaceae bacterium]
MSRSLGCVLDERAMDQLNAEESTVILATVSPDGYPNTTPVHLAVAKDPRTLLLGLSVHHRGTENIRANPYVMICLCEKNDLNISMKCQAKVVAERLNSNRAMCAVEARVIEIKDDSTHSRTTSGIRYACKTEKGEVFIRDVFRELKGM